MASEMRPAIRCGSGGRARWRRCRTGSARRSIGHLDREAPAVVGALHDLGGAEQVGAVEIGEQPLVDRARAPTRFMRRAVAFDRRASSARWRGCGPQCARPPARSARAADRRRTLAGTPAHNPDRRDRMGARSTNGSENARERDEAEHDDARDGGAVATSGARARRPRASGRRRRLREFGGNGGASAMAHLNRSARADR